MRYEDLLMKEISLLSQKIVSSKNIPEGDILQKTSCMNPEDAEMMGILLFLRECCEKEEDTEALKELDEFIIPFFEILGLSRWNRSELTQLGFRAGKRIHDDIRATNP